MSQSRVKVLSLGPRGLTEQLLRVGLGKRRSRGCSRGAWRPRLCPQGSHLPALGVWGSDRPRPVEGHAAPHQNL